MVLALLALVAVGTWLVSERARLAHEAAEAAERRVVSFDPEAVREIVVEKPGERVVARLDSGRWRLTAPDEMLADGPTIQGLLAFVRRVEKVRVLGTVGDLREYGLDAPRVRLRLVARDGQALSLALAGPNPTRTGIYASVDDAPVVFLAPGELATELGKSPYIEQLRDRAILPVDADRMRRVEVERADARIAIVRVGEHRWRVERPFSGPGDDGIVRDFLWKLGASRAREVIREPGPPARYGLDRPHARGRLEDAAGGVQVFTAALDERTGRVYVAIEGRPAIYVTDGQLLADLAIGAEHFRDRQLLPLDPREVERISIQYAGTRLVVARGDAGWRVLEPVEGEAVGVLVENLLEVLPNLRHTGMAARRPQDLARYGLDRPRLVVRVGLRGGQELPAVSVGREERGVNFVMVGGAAPVYMVDARLLRVIPDDPADAKRYSLPEQLKRGRQKLEQDKS